MIQRQIELFSKLRLLLNVTTDKELVDKLSKRSPGRGNFSRESIRRWSNGTQELRKNNRLKLSIILGCSPEQMESYFDELTSLDELIAEMDIKTQSIDFEKLKVQAIDAASEMPLPLLTELISELITICDRRWSDFREQEQLED